MDFRMFKNIEPITSSLLNNENIIHGFFTKNAGITRHNSLNLNYSFKNIRLKKPIYDNRKLIADYHNLKLTNLKTINQIHSNKVIIIDNNKQNTNSVSADALITKIPNIILGILTADCAPTLIYDKKEKIIAAIHIGWKGAYYNILEETIKNMIILGSNINNLLLAIGPCIGPKSYEVKKDLIDKFIKKKETYKAHFVKINNKYYFNLANLIHSNALQIGLNNNNIWLANKDTYSNKRLFFSYRRNIKNNSPDLGRMISTISLIKK